MTQIILRDGGCGRVCRDILAGLPQWVGIAEANAAYEAEAEILPTWLALEGGEPVGLMIIKPHASALENWLLAVRRDLRGQGIGRRLMARADQVATQAGMGFVTVKTLGPSHPSQPYAETRAFYRSVGFTPLEEFTEIWGPDNPCLLMAKALPT